MIVRAALLLSLFALAACASPRSLPRAEVPATEQPLDPSIKPLTREQEEQVQ